MLTAPWWLATVTSSRFRAGADRVKRCELGLQASQARFRAQMTLVVMSEECRPCLGNRPARKCGVALVNGPRAYQVVARGTDGNRGRILADIEGADVPKARKARQWRLKL